MSIVKQLRKLIDQFLYAYNSMSMNLYIWQFSLKSTHTGRPFIPCSTIIAYRTESKRKGTKFWHCHWEFEWDNQFEWNDVIVHMKQKLIDINNDEHSWWREKTTQNRNSFGYQFLAPHNQNDNKSIRVNKCTMSKIYGMPMKWLDWSS